MRLARVGLALTVVNLLLLVFLLAEVHPVTAQNQAPVLRGRALQIVDAQGRVRAEILVHGPERVGSKLYPETVLFRMGDPNKRPVVKLTASEEGAALGLSDDAAGGVQLYGRRNGSVVKVVASDGREATLKP